MALSFKEITCFIFDMDGVLTDGTVLVLENGLQARRMFIKDGYALQLAVKRGYRIVVLSGATAPSVIDRLMRLGITEIHMGVSEKRKFVSEFTSRHQIKKEEILFMGDDMPDLEVMDLAGIASCPADAINEIKAVAGYISPFNGGVGCVRDVIEQVMKAREDWFHQEGVASR